MTDLTKKKDAALAAIQKVQVLAELDEQRVNALGKKGWVSLALKTLGGMSPEERAEAAPAIQEVRNAIAEAINSKSSKGAGGVSSSCKPSDGRACRNFR